MSLLKRIFSFCIYVLLLIGLFLGPLETLLRVGIIQPSFEITGWEIVLDRHLLFRLKPESRTDVNVLGFRSGPIKDKKEGTRRILMLGDSFTLGVNVSHENTTAGRLQKILGNNYDVVNAGVLGYGPDQSLVQLETAGLRIDPDMVVLTLYPINDYSDIIRNQLLTIEPGGALIRRGENTVTQILPPFEFQYYGRYLAYKWAGKDSGFEELFEQLFYDGIDIGLIEKPDSKLSLIKLQLMQRILREFRDRLDQEGIPFFVVILPSYEAFHSPEMFEHFQIPPENRFMPEILTSRICRELGIPFVNLAPYFEGVKDKIDLYDDTDQHLSEEGYAFTASILYAKLNEEGLL